MIKFPAKIITRRTSSSTKYTDNDNNAIESPRRYSIGIIPSIINASYLTNSVPENTTSSSGKPINTGTRISADNQMLSKKDDNKNNNNLHKNNACNLAPSQKSSKGDRITSWSTGFDNLLNDAEGLRHFTTFLEGQYAVENIEFWQACQRCKKLGEADKQKEMAECLITTYEDFVQEQVINLDSGLTNEFKALMAIAKNEPESLSNNPLERQERHIYQLLKTDCYPRFLKSDIYKSIFTRENFEAGTKKGNNIPLEAESENIQKILEK